jgi:multiple sugar transport system ATP-binding protein
MNTASGEQPRIELQGVAKRFGDVAAVARLDLAVKTGEFVVLLGPSGCGKTTTLRMIAGLESPSEGRITISGRDVTDLRPGARDIAFVFQLFALYPHLTAEQNIAFPLRAAGVPPKVARQRVDEVIQRLELGPIRRQRPRNLSGGDQQRVCLARAMVREPAAFLMDEPLGTLDADQRERTRQQLRAIHNELGATTVFVTHDQLEAMALADRIAVMRDGRLLQYDTPRRVYDYPADLFVAHFIGSPGMNFLEARRRGPDMQIDGAGLRLTVDPAGSTSDGIRLGVRPEHVLIDDQGAPCGVEHTERLGPYNLVELRIGDAMIKARVPPDVRYAEGERARVRFEPSGCRWFDAAGGQALPWRTLACTAGD